MQMKSRFHAEYYNHRAAADSDVQPHCSLLNVN